VRVEADAAVGVVLIEQAPHEHDVDVCPVLLRLVVGPPQGEHRMLGSIRPDDDRRHRGPDPFRGAEGDRDGEDTVESGNSRAEFRTT
jgi:hypothetical protein